MSSTIVFLRGFNSYESEDLRLGPLNLGRAHKYLEPAFRQKGFNFISLNHIGKGEIDGQIALGREQMARLKMGGSFTGPIHLLGHSAGGVIARGLAHALQNATVDIASVVSITSPHRGSALSELIPNLKSRRPLLYKSLRWAGYNIEDRLHLFEHWQKSQLHKFNQQYPNLPEVAYGSIVSGNRVQKLPLPFRFINKSIPQPDFETDGIVEVEAQPWGTVLSRLNLDHGAIIGFRTAASSAGNQRNLLAFNSMVQSIAEFFRANEQREGSDR